MSLAPCSDAQPADASKLTDVLIQRIEDLERRLAETGGALRRAEAEIALLNDRLAWAEADLAVAAGCAREDPASLRPLA